MIQLKPAQSDLPRLKKPFGRLISGEADQTMPELQRVIKKARPTRISAVGDVVSRETLARGIPVDLRIIDYISMRRPSAAFEITARKTYHVKNPAGVITQDSWETIKKAMRERDVMILVEGEEDLLTLPTIVESPENALVLYGQPSEGLVVVNVNPAVKTEASQILGRMIREEERSGS